MFDALIYEYDQILINEQKEPSMYFFSSSAYYNELNALKIFRYAFGTILKWRPEELAACRSLKIVHEMKLDYFLSQINFPPEVSQEYYLLYIASKLYPNKVHYDEEHITCDVYKKLLKIKPGDIQKFPKNFAIGENGRFRAEVCLRYMISHFVIFHNIDELYKIFAAPTAVDLLKRYKLYNISSILYETPLDYLHAALDDSQKNNTLYYYLKFENSCKKK